MLGILTREEAAYFPGWAIAVIVVVMLVIVISVVGCIVRKRKMSARNNMQNGGYASAGVNYDNGPISYGNNQQNPGVNPYGYGNSNIDGGLNNANQQNQPYFQNNSNQGNWS